MSDMTPKQLKAQFESLNKKIEAKDLPGIQSEAGVLIAELRGAEVDYRSPERGLYAFLLKQLAYTPVETEPRSLDSWSAHIRTATDVFANSAWYPQDQPAPRQAK
jgi:hypothetical protein